MPLATPNTPDVPAVDPRQQVIDWVLFAFTCAGAVVVYGALYAQSLWGFLIGETVCGFVWLLGFLYKRARSRHMRRA